MTTYIVEAIADTDRELGFECDKAFSMGEVETLDQLAYFFAEVARGAGFNYVDGVVFIKDDGNECSSYDFTGK